MNTAIFNFCLESSGHCSSDEDSEAHASLVADDATGKEGEMGLKHSKFPCPCFFPFARGVEKKKWMSHTSDLPQTACLGWREASAGTQPQTWGGARGITTDLNLALFMIHAPEPKL